MLPQPRQAPDAPSRNHHLDAQGAQRFGSALQDLKLPAKSQVTVHEFDNELQSYGCSPREALIMETDEYKITYRDGSTQRVRASQQLAQEPWLVFQDDYTEVLRIQAADIESVRRADVADRERPVNARQTR